MTGSFEAQREQVGRVLAASLPYSPHDYIRQPAGFRERDRQSFAAQLTRLLPQEDDLRFVHAAPTGSYAVVAEKLPWDTAFFGYGVARLHGIFPMQTVSDPSDITAAVVRLLSSCRDHGVRYLFSITASEESALLHALTAAGFVLIETRLHFHGEIAAVSPSERYPVRLADASDLPELRRTARTAVNAFDRFHADPFITPEDAGRLMEAWMDASVIGGFADGVVVPREKPASAFCSIKFHRQQWDDWGYQLAQIPLGAVSPERSGLYSKLIAEALCLLKDGGAKHVYYVTQAANRAAIRVCEKVGLRYGRAEHVLRCILR